MESDPPRSGAKRPAVYLLLLAIHTAAALTLAAVMFPLFQQIVMHIGKPQQLQASTALAAALAAIVMQACYWIRHEYVQVSAPVRGALASHLALFASRVSFFFSGAVFSAIFFRHVPQLEALPPAGQGLAKAIGVMALLFASFCYALELEHLGRAIAQDDRRD